MLIGEGFVLFDEDLSFKSQLLNILLIFGDSL